jgi:5-methylcytosine-specific restriction endonuclease McrA
MARREFPKSVKVATIKRATRNGVTYCEECGALAKSWEIDHANPDGLTGEPTLENAVLLCTPCHKEKTRGDVTKIAKAKRREANHLGIRKQPTLKSPGFTPAPPQGRATKPLAKITPPRRQMYRSEM